MAASRPSWNQFSYDSDPRARLRHLIIGSALLVFVALDVVFVEFSETPSAALVFSVLSYLILLLLSGAAGRLPLKSGFAAIEGDRDYDGNLLGTVPGGTLGRVAIERVQSNCGHFSHGAAVVCTQTFLKSPQALLQGKRGHGSLH